MTERTRILFNLVVLTAILLSACMPSTGEPTPEDRARPGQPVYQQIIYDCNTGDLVPDAPSASNPIEPSGGCDSWQINRYERPFNAEIQDVFYADLDILSGELGRDADWFYFRLNIFDENEENGYLGGAYALEIDLDLDGRGDVLVFAQSPDEEAAEDWTVTGVQFWGDGNNDVGNQIPQAPDQQGQFDGYDTLVFDQGRGDDPDLAWVRLRPGKPAVLEIAFKSQAILYDEVFKWWAWSDQGIANPASADYHDTFDHPEAGDPIQSQTYFPSQAIFEVDNTCAAIWGALPGDDPELCVNDASVPPPEQTPPVENTPTSTSPVITNTPGDPTITPTDPETTQSATPTEPETDETETPTPTEPTSTPCVPIDSNNTAGAAAPNTCTPTPTETPTRPDSTPCVPGGPNIAGVPTGIPTCTPTATPTPSPTVCATFDVTGQLVDCTPTPTITATVCFNYSITAATAPQIATCTPTPTPTETPTDCVVPYAFAVIHCTSTPTLTATVTPTRCVEINEATGAQIECTPTVTASPTPTLCVEVLATALLPCTPTPTATLCISSTTAAAVVTCTPSPTPTPCTITDEAGNVIDCTPTPEIVAYMGHPMQDTNCREAPGSRILDTLFEGIPWPLLGRDSTNTWLFGRGPNGRLCWALASLFDIYYMGQLIPLEDTNLPIILLPTATFTPAPPTPGGGGGPTATNTPTPTCTPLAGSTGQSNC